MENRNKINKQEYLTKYCRDKRVRNRRILYVSDFVHNSLRQVAFNLRDKHVTITSLVDSILRVHISENSELFRELQKESDDEFLNNETKGQDD